MCLAICKPRGIEIPVQYLRNGFENNNDGAGIAYLGGNGELIVRRGFFNVDKLIEVYEEHKASPMLIHFRWATHGAVCKTNCHPWRFGARGQFAAIHNGVIPIAVSKNESDTGAFVNTILTPLSSRLNIHSETMKRIVELAIGAGNKIAVMDSRGRYTIYNEGAGKWVNGVWYSNSDYEPTSYRRCYSGWVDSDTIEWRSTDKEPAVSYPKSVDDPRYFGIHPKDFYANVNWGTGQRKAPYRCPHCHAILDDIYHWMEAGPQNCPFCDEPIFKSFAGELFKKNVKDGIVIYDHIPMSGGGERPDGVDRAIKEATALMLETQASSNSGAGYMLQVDRKVKGSRLPSCPNCYVIMSQESAMALNIGLNRCGSCGGAFHYSAKGDFYPVTFVGGSDD